MKHYCSCIGLLLHTTTLTFPAFGLSSMTADKQPPPKKQKVDGDATAADVPDEKTAENLAPWAGRWENRQIGFHLSEVNPVLKEFVHKLLPDKAEDEETKTCSNRRVFFPLCGKTVDMPFLVPMADELVGVEGVRQALEEFAAEHPDLKVESKGVEGGYERFQGEKITLLKGDFFELDDEKTGGRFGAIFDRGSLVAIEPKMREKYVEIMGKLIAPGGRILIVALERRGEGEAVKRGPPFSVPDATARELYETQDWVESMTILQETDQLERNPEDRKRYEGLDKLLEVVYLVQAK